MKKLKKLIGVLVAVSLLISLLPTHVVSAVSGNELVEEARKWCRTYSPYSLYSSGAGGPGNPVDCSGLMQQVYGAFGISLPRTTYKQVLCGNAVSYNNMQPGDLIFMYGNGHVLMYSGNGNVIHASSGQHKRVVEVKMWFGPGEINNIRRIVSGTPSVHTHSWNYGNDSGHPHREYRICSCGEKQYTGGTRLVSSCQSCYPVGEVNLTRSFSKTLRDVTFYRNNVVNANSYSLTLYRNGSSYGTYQMPSTSKYISNLPSGNYTATLTAKNTSTGQSRSASCEAFTIVDTYDVVYDANGGTNAPQPQIKIKDTDLTIISVVPKNTGYVFKGWAPNRTATEPQYLAGGSYTKNTKITLYAVWEPEIYTINFDVNGGKGEAQSTTITYGNTMKMPNTVIREGYYLKGWSQTKGASTPDYKIGMDYKLTSNMTLYAVWGQSTWSGTVASGFAGGDGTENNPYQISNAAELAHLADIVNNQQTEPEYKYYVLTDNINLGYEEWIPIGLYGNENQYFKGSFDGNGYTISDLNITDINEGYVGLFGYAKGSEIKGVTVSGDITGITSSIREISYLGSVIAYSDSTNIVDCTASYVNISDIATKEAFYIGGICGIIIGESASISRCNAFECYANSNSNSGQYGKYRIGMIVGVSESSIYDCTVKSTEELISTSGLYGYLVFGGICGEAKGNESETIILRCNVMAGAIGNNVRSSDMFVGGIAGHSSVPINICSVTFLNGFDKVVDGAQIKSSINTMQEGGIGRNYTGGIAGYGKSIKNCKYNGKSISAYNVYAGHYDHSAVGGISGSSISVEKSFSIVDGIIYGSTQQNNYAFAGGITGRTDLVHNSIAIANKVSSVGNTWLYAYGGDIAGASKNVINNYEYNTNIDCDNVYSNSSMELSAVNTYEASNAKTITLGTKRTLTQMKRASFLKQVYGPAYQSVEYLKENPEAVWVIKDGEYPELYFTVLNDITVSDVENGTISVDKTQAVDGEVINVTAVPNENYVLNKIYVNGSEIVGSTFEVSGDSDVYATFAEKTAEYNVKVQSTENASATLVNADDVQLNSVSLLADSDSISAADGEEIKVNTSAADNYTVDAVYVNGEELAGDSFIVDDNSVVTMAVTSTDTAENAVTYAAKDIKGNGAMLGGKTDGEQKYIRYWKAGTPDEVYTTEVQDGSGEYSVEVTDLELGETYEYQMTEFGDIKSFVPVYATINDIGSVLADPNATSVPIETDKPIATDTPIVEPESMLFEIQNVQAAGGKVTADITNVSAMPQSGIVIFAAYSSNGMLAGVENRDIQNLDSKNSLPCEFTMPSGASKYKIFIWNSYREMMPLAESIER